MYQIPPSSAGATSWGRDPGGSENACREVSEDDSVGEVFCEVGSEVDILGSLAIEGRVADGGETGAVGVTEALHPINTRTIEIPRNDEDNPVLILGKLVTELGSRARDARAPTPWLGGPAHLGSPSCYFNVIVYRGPIGNRRR